MEIRPEFKTNIVAKYKIEFSKFRKGQSFYQRSFTIEQMEILLVMCDDVQVHLHRNKKKGSITFIFEGKEYNRFARCKDLRVWILKKFVPEKEWK
jgi:hypothetical protein